MVAPLNLANSGSVLSPGRSQRCELAYYETLSRPPLFRKSVSSLMQNADEPEA